MSYTLYTTQIEIVDETMKETAVVITAVDDCAANIEFRALANFDNWYELSNAIKRALRDMKLYAGADEEVNVQPHGY
jgi:hypothetical protein